MTRQRRVELRHLGGMRFGATTGTGRALEFGDAEEANEHSPVEMVTAAVAACSAMDVVSILEKKRQIPGEYSVRVEATQRDEYPQVLTRVDIFHELTGSSVTEAGVRRAIQLSATKYCPVNAMLSAGDTAVHHHYRIRRSGTPPSEVAGEVVVTGPYRRPDVIGS
ncbi:MAG TPA: OsmC family protein [Vitreimonas sp.]|nr:OsmC family protein [Vitreimonas sp.]